MRDFAACDAKPAQHCLLTVRSPTSETLEKHRQARWEHEHSNGLRSLALDLSGPLVVDVENDPAGVAVAFELCLTGAVEMTVNHRPLEKLASRDDLLELGFLHEVVLATRGAWRTGRVGNTER